MVFVMILVKIISTETCAILCNCCQMPFCTLFIMKLINYVELEIKLNF